MRTTKLNGIVWIACGLFFLILLFGRCAKEQIEKPPVFFQEDVFPIIVTNCTESKCHNSVDRVEGYDFTTYDGILKAVKPGDYKGSELYKSLVSTFSPMPYDDDRLSDEQISTIALWIKSGAENSSSGGSGCNTSNVTFNGTILPLLDLWCHSCHAGSFPSGDIRLVTYNEVKTKVNDGTLLGSIRHDPGYVPMPDGGAKLPQCDIERFEQWIADGAKNN